MELPIENPREQIEKNLAAKRAAKDKKAKDEDGKKEYTPEEKEEIKNLAYYIWEHRMSNDPERQKKWAKEYGLDENAFSKEVIEGLISGSVGKDKQWTADAEKFMRDWDWQTAEKIFKNKNLKKTDEKEPPSPDTGDKAVISPDQKPVEDMLKKQAPEDKRQIENEAIREERLEERISEEEKRKMEFEAEKGDIDQAELNKAITDFEAKQSQIAEMRAKKAGRWASLRKTLGLKEKNLDGDPEVMSLEKESHELYRSLMAKGINLYKGDKPQLENFLKQYDEFEVFRNGQNQELDKKAEVAGFPENIIAGMKTLTKKWSELSWKQKLAISIGGGALVGAGAFALGAGTFGAAALSAGYKWGFRAFGAAAAGYGRNVMLDRQMMDEMRNASEMRVQERMKELENYGNNLDQGIENMMSKTSVGAIKKDFEQRRTENELRAWKFGRNTFIISAVVGETLAASGVSFGSVLRKIGEYTGLSGGGTGPISEITHPQSGRPITMESSNGTGKPPESVLTGEFRATENSLNPSEQSHTDQASGIFDNRPVSRVTELQAGRPEYTETSATEKPHFAEQSHTENAANSPIAGTYPEGKVGLVGYGSETSGHDLVDSHPEGKYGPNFSGSESSGHEVVDSHPEGKYGPGLHGSEGEGHDEIVKSTQERYGYGKYGPAGGGTETEGHNVVDSHPEGKYGPGLHGSEGEGHDLVDSHPEGKYGPNFSGSESSGHEVVDSHPEGKYGPGLHGSEGEGHIADMRELASVKIKPGGTMWGGIESKIKANPSDFGLDPKDPNFTKDMHRMTKQLLDEFAYRKGMSYEDLDQIARTKVMAGDSFKLMYDPSTEELSIDDYHGKVFGPDIVSGVAGEEVVSSKQISSLQGGNIAAEEVKLRTGAAEHQPTRGGGMRLPNEILENEKIAKEDFAKADQYQKDVRAYNAKEAVRLEGINSAADTRLYLSTRGLLNQLVNGAGVGDRANFWSHSMNDWGKLLGSENYIAQDVQLADETRVVSFDKLKNLYPILEKYHKLGIESIGDCLKEAIKDPKNVYMINRLVLRK